MVSIIMTTFKNMFVLYFVVANFGQEWEVSEVSTKTAYRSGLKGEIHAEIGVKIGLRSVNITLKGSDLEIKFNKLLACFCYSCYALL